MIDFLGKRFKDVYLLWTKLPKVIFSYNNE